MRSLALRAKRWARHERACSSQASRSPSSALPALATGLDGRWGRVERCVARLPRFMQYVDQRMFAPSLSTAHHALIFAAINAPQRLDLDVDDFLRGVAAATTRVLLDASSEEFTQLVESNGALVSASPVLERMQRYCLPSCFRQLQMSLRRTLRHNLKRRIHDVEVESIELRGGPQQEEDESEMPTAERLLLHVEIRTREYVQEIRQINNGRKVEESLQHNVYVAKFISRVTVPDDVDWRLAGIALRTKGERVALELRPRV